MKEINWDCDDWFLFGVVFIIPIIGACAAVCIKILIVLGVIDGHWIIEGKEF